MAQNDSLSVVRPPSKYAIHFSIGTDIWAPVVGLFTDRRGYSVLGNLQVYPKWFLQTQLGWERNRYEEIGWEVESSGAYLKLGANYIITQDPKEPNNRFYVGAKIGMSSFSQDLEQVPIRAIGQTTQYTNLGTDDVSAYWLDIPLGARVAITKKYLFLEAMVSTQILLHSSSDLGIDPVIIPNFGKNNAGLNFNVFWGLVFVWK